MAYNVSVDDESLDVRVKSVTSNLTLSESHSYLYVDSDANSI